MSMILATEIFQARRDAVLTTSKILLDNSKRFSTGKQYIICLSETCNG